MWIVQFLNMLSEENLKWDLVGMKDKGWVVIRACDILLYIYCSACNRCCMNKCIIIFLFAAETECWADYAKRIMPIVVGAVVAGIILIAVLVFVLKRERRGRGYEQLWVWSTSKPQTTTAALFCTPKSAQTSLLYCSYWIQHEYTFRIF